MKYLFFLLTMIFSTPLMATCAMDYFADYEQYDFRSMDDVRQFCNNHARNFEIIQVTPKEVKSLKDNPDFDEYCFYVQRRNNGYYRYDARFYYQLGRFEGRGRWDIFHQFEEWSYYKVYGGFPLQIRLHFPAQCSD